MAKIGIKKGAVPPANMQKVKKGTFGRLLKYLFKRKGQLAIVIVCILISSLVSVVSSAFMKTLIDGYIAPLREDFLGGKVLDFAPMLALIFSVCAVYVFGVICNVLYQRLMLNVAQGAICDIRDEMFTKMQRLPIRYFDTHTHGDLMSRYTNDTDTLRQMLSQSIPSFISTVVTLVGVLTAMFVYNWLLTLVMLVMLTVSFAVVKVIGGKSGKYYVASQAAVGKVNGYIEEMLEGQRVVKVFNHEDKAKSDFAVLNEDNRIKGTKANSYAIVLMPILGNYNNIVYVMVAVIGAIMSINGFMGLSIGTLVSFLMLVKSFAQPIGQFSQQFNSIIMALAGADRIFGMMDEMPEVDEGTVELVKAEHEGLFEADCEWYWKKPLDDGEYEYTPLCGDIRFHEVEFSYDGEKTVLHDVSLFAKPGQKIAFVGSTGAGKTTITNLINRFYDIQSGRITYDGIDVKCIKKDSLRRSLSMVLQDTHMFTGTVMENIRYGRLDATDAEVVAAAKLANAHSFIKHLPNGYHTVLTGDGENLSQGQRQLLNIARAAVADAPVLILDEATSSIDTRTEAIIEKGMDSLMAGRTVFVIAHRLSTVRNSQAIIVLEHGRIIERGSHDDLIALGQKYYQLYTGAFELS